jgi:hypothetical protein
MHDADNILDILRPFKTNSYTDLVLYLSSNFETSVHGSWEDLPLKVTGYCSDNADMEAEGGKVSKESL